ncbi:glycosyltransferase [Luteimonas fraxinea]|uniref:glycosyltransferase n=1 Tax=Luteimonas fraxinea TaxID=2901869 RepID=UPI001E59842A|nr:glycosyltransferase [Luteimonas fraxinea]UHH08571.1 glycosyltransferase [Luteimonas fraxinea]
MTPGILYISYSGMLEPLGQSQVLAYQERLASSFTIHLVSFERAEDLDRADELKAVGHRMQAAGIHWHRLSYHKRFSALATAWDIIQGSMLGLKLVRRHGLSVVHARSYVSSAMALVIKRVTKIKYVFDMRGFWADERVDGGLWPRNGRMYRLAKWFERRFLLRADHVVSLTHAAVREMERFNYLKGAMPPVTVIPTCADLAKFVPTSPPQGNFVLGYVGSAGTWYLFDNVVTSFVELLKLKPDARFLIINRNEHDYIRERLAAGQVPMDRVELRPADHASVPAQMARMHAGVFFIKPAFSKQASAPTKLGEFLGCGIPCLGNSGVGDMADVLEGERVGVAIGVFDVAAIRHGVERILALVDDPDVRDRCVAAAGKNFSLDEGVSRYRAVYRSLSGHDGSRAA